MVYALGKSPHYGLGWNILFIGIVAWVSAASRSASGWTLDQALRAALARAPEVRASRAGQAESEAQLAQVRAGRWPQVTTEVGYLPHWPRNEIRLPALGGQSALEAPEVDDIHRFRATLSLSYRPVDLARGARIDAAAALIDQAHADQAQTAAQLAYEVRAVFLAALHARDVVHIATESLTQARREERRATLRLEAGVGTQVGLAQARVRSANLAAQLARAQINLQRQRELLQSYLGIEQLPWVEGDLRNETDLTQSRHTTQHESVKRSAQTAGLMLSPALNKLRAAKRAAELSAQAYALAWVPTLALLASGGWQYPRALRLELGPYVEGGVLLNWELFDGTLRGAREREARARAERLDAQRKGLHQQLERRLIALRARREEARANLLAAETALRENELYLRVAVAAVQTGTGTELDRHQAELNLDRARIAVSRALLDAALVGAEQLLVLGVVTPASRSSRRGSLP